LTQIIEGVSSSWMLKIVANSLLILLLIINQAYASAKLIEARRAYNSLQFPKAEALYKAILDDHKSSNESKLEALFGLGRIKHSFGSLADTKNYLKEAIKLAPWRGLAKENYPPSFVEMYEEIKKSIINETGNLAITSEPPFVEVNIDGIKVGYTPLTIPKVPTGSYKVEANLPGYEKSEQEIIITKDSKKLITLNLKPEIVQKSTDLAPSIEDKGTTALSFVKQSTMPETREQNWWDKPWIWGSSLVILGGITAFALTQIGKSGSENGTISISLP
jgi:hypothetical protein